MNASRDLAERAARHEWLEGGRLRAWLEPHHTPLIPRIVAAADDPLTHHWWPKPIVEQIVDLWAHRAVFCDALERLPTGFGHGDAIRRNLFDRGDRTLAIDWERTGLYAVGEEVGQTLSVGAAFFDLEPEDLPTLDEALFEGYLAGLTDAGWQGKVRVVRFAYAAHCALRNIFNAVGTGQPTDDQAESALQRFGQSWRELAERRAACRPFLLERAREARRLLEVL